MAQLDSLLPLVRVHVEGCPVPTALQQLRWALREFCKESRFLRESVPVEILAGQMVYPMAPLLAETRVVEVDAVTVDGRPLNPTGPKEVRPSSLTSAGVVLDDETGAVVQQPGEVTHYWFEPPADLVVWPQPTRDADGAVSLILDVLPATVLIPDAIERKYADAISYGALHRLLMMPKKAWSDPALGGYYDGLFRRQIEEAKSEASRQHRRRHYRVRPHY
jgi:hypothetical protein